MFVKNLATIIEITRCNMAEVRYSTLAILTMNWDFQGSVSWNKSFF